MTRTRTPLLLCLFALLLGTPVIGSASSKASVMTTTAANQEFSPRHPTTPTPMVPLQGVHHHHHNTTPGLDNTNISTTRDPSRDPQTSDNIQVAWRTSRSTQTNVDKASLLSGDKSSVRNTSMAALTVVVVTVVRGDNSTDRDQENKGREEREEDRRFSCPLSSRRVCFLTLWALAVTASLFFGLTIFLWVRLSARSQSPAQEGSPTPREDLGNMWAVRRSSVGERAEFWYASPRTARQREEATGRMTAVREGERLGRGGRKENMGVEEVSGLLTQPRVTLEDISDFWYSNGRVVTQELSENT